MTPLALVLLLASAALHAIWNLLAKRAHAGGAFLWMTAALSTAVYAPFALIVLFRSGFALGPAVILTILGSAAIHSVYFIALLRGYRSGDLSLVYPLARGTGPLLATLAAIAWFGERPSPLALLGTLLVVAGVVVLTSDQWSGGRRQIGAGVAYGLATGVLIAGYTLWDKRAVGPLAIPPLFFDWASNLGRTALLAPLAVRRDGEVREIWRKHRRDLIAVAILSPLSYVLFLTALAFSPVSAIAPAREISILFGVILGARLLAEGSARRRLAAAAVMVAGVIALAFG